MAQTTDRGRGNVGARHKERIHAGTVAGPIPYLGTENKCTRQDVGTARSVGSSPNTCSRNANVARNVQVGVCLCRHEAVLGCTRHVTPVRVASEGQAGAPGRRIGASGVIANQPPTVPRGIGANRTTMAPFGRGHGGSLHLGPRTHACTHSGGRGGGVRICKRNHAMDRTRLLCSSGPRRRCYKKGKSFRFECVWSLHSGGGAKGGTVAWTLGGRGPPLGGGGGGGAVSSRSRRALGTGGHRPARGGPPATAPRHVRTLAVADVFPVRSVPNASQRCATQLCGGCPKLWMWPWGSCACMPEDRHHQDCARGCRGVWERV